MWVHNSKFQKKRCDPRYQGHNSMFVGYCFKVKAARMWTIFKDYRSRHVRPIQYFKYFNKVCKISEATARMRAHNFEDHQSGMRPFLKPKLKLWRLIVAGKWAYFTWMQLKGYGPIFYGPKKNYLGKIFRPCWIVYSSRGPIFLMARMWTKNFYVRALR